MEMLAKMIKSSEILLTVGKNDDRRPWPETRIFIDLDSACRNQQLEGNSDAVENKARPFLLFFSIVVEFMQ